MTAVLSTRRFLSYFAALVLIAFSAGFVLETANPQQANAQSSVRPPAGATTDVTGGTVPGMSRSSDSSSEMWRAVRKGVKGNVSIPDEKAKVLVQSEGDNWRALRNGPLATWGVLGLLGMLVALVVFYFARGKIMIDHGMSGKTVTRFADLERTAHWLLAVSFIILAITGLNITYGKYFLLPVIGKPAFAWLAGNGKWLHDYVGFAFMAGLVMIFVLWVKENFANVDDMKWLARGGGLFTKGDHPPARKFNAGQKILFWLIIWGGLALSFTGIAKLFPFQIDFPVGMEPIHQMQFMATWHAIIAMVLIVVVIAHIYIGTIGMQGAFDAMGSGEVDQNWAKEHHSIWAKEAIGPKRKKKSKSGGAATAPAE